MDIDKICINCMEDSLSDGVCPSCGYHEGTYQKKPHHLSPCIILNGRYLLGRVLGEGGFGITYLTYDLIKHERVAIKEFFVTGLLIRENTRTVLVDESVANKAFYEECKAKFTQEAVILRKLKDRSGIVTIYDDFAENNTQYIVMEYLDGAPLSWFLQQNGGRIPFDTAFKVLTPAMRSLREMHLNSVYHRDISPDNIQYLKDARVKIMDLGGSKDMMNSIVKSHIVAVKHGYAPPEQYVTRYKIGPWMDVYAMAATIYRCITGVVPPQSTSRMSDTDTLKPPRELGADISPEIEQVILKGMALQVEDRYMDMGEFYSALKKAEEESRAAHTPPEITQNTEDPPEEAEDPGYKALVDQLNGRKPSFGWAVGMVIVIILAMIGMNYGWLP